LDLGVIPLSIQVRGKVVFNNDLDGKKFFRIYRFLIYQVIAKGIYALLSLTSRILIDKKIDKPTLEQNPNY